MRFATLDIGTNTVLLLVAERGPEGRFVPVLERMEITRLGRGVDRTGELSREALADTLDALRRFAGEARALGASAIAATATSAARDARNGHLLIEGAAACGVPVEIIAGDHEARLAFRAAAADFAPAEGQLAVVDIGGGSTEVIVGEHDAVRFRRSFDVGSVRLTERCLTEDPPGAQSLRTLESTLAAALEAVPRIAPGTPVVGIAGTFTTLAAIARVVDPYDASRVHGAEVTLAELDALARRLAALGPQERLRVPGLHPKRADVIVAGAFLAAEVVRRLGSDRVTVGDRGIRWGYLYERFG